MTSELYGYTDFHTAVHWLSNNLILMNNIPKLDYEIYDCIYDTTSEIMQWYATDCTDDEVQYLQKVFGLDFVYSNNLQIWVLLICHWGTSWDYVKCPVYDKQWWEINKEKHEYRH